MLSILRKMDLLREASVETLTGIIDKNLEEEYNGNEETQIEDYIKKKIV